jgi:hypothetical protein
MAKVISVRLILAIIIVNGALAAACSPVRAIPPDGATLVAFPATSTFQCVQEEVLPKIRDIRPTEIAPGSEVTVSGSGGYFRDSCGGTNEGARAYKIYLDNEPIADLLCYINHCEGKFVLADSIAIGPHCVGVQKGTCQIELQVTGR